MCAWMPCDRALTLREGHPSGHAGFLLTVEETEGVITSAAMDVGYMHRGAEKLFESRDYRQVMMLANRHDWLSAIHSELAIALNLEQCMGITPPERATWIRMLLAEMNRIAVALAFIAPVLEGIVRQRALDAREALIGAQEIATGGRMHPMYTRIGGVAHGLGTVELDAIDTALAQVTKAWDEIGDAIDAYAGAISSVSVLSRQQAIDYGTSGAVARASGLDIDLRRQQPYLAYAEVADLLPTNACTSGDAADRYRALAAQVGPSLRICERASAQARSRLDEAFDVPLPKSVRAPEGLTSMSIEGPLGIMGTVLVMPWRLRLRTASFNNAQAMQFALPGTHLDHVGDAVMSFFLVVGDIDR